MAKILDIRYLCAAVKWHSVKCRPGKPSSARQIIDQERGEDQCGEYRVEQQYRQHGVISQCCFLRCIIESEKCRGDES